MMDRTVAVRFLAPHKCARDRFRTIRRCEHSALRANFHGNGLNDRGLSSYRRWFRLGFIGGLVLRRLIVRLISWERRVLIGGVFRWLVAAIALIAVIAVIGVFAVFDLNRLIVLIDLRVLTFTE